jgi:hypothetical protein
MIRLERIQRCLRWPSPKNDTHKSKKFSVICCRGEPPLATFKGKRMRATGLNSSTKLGAYLALGCLTARQIHAALEASAASGTSKTARGMNGDNPQALGVEGTLAAALEEGGVCLKLHLQIRFAPPLTPDSEPICPSPHPFSDPACPSPQPIFRSGLSLPSPLIQIQLNPKP